MTVDLKNAQTTNVIVNTREDIFARRYEMLNDNYKDQVKKRLLEIYSKASLLNMDKQLDMTNNVYKMIVNKISRVYNAGVDRVFSNDGMAELYETVKIDKYMNQANRLVNALNDVLIQVSWNTETNLPILTFRYPHRTKVVTDAHGKPLEVEYLISSDNTTERWAFWSITEHYYKDYKADGSFDVVMIDGNENGVNPYGVLTFVFMQNGFRDGYFWDMYTGNDMVECTLDMAVYNTFKNYMIKWQSFKQIIVQGSNVGAISGQVLDPSQALTAEGENIKIDVLDLQANLKELQEVIDHQMTNLAINYNISPSQFRLTGEVSSGFALQMENAQLDEFTQGQQSDFIGYEQSLNRLIVIVGNTEGNNYSADNFEVTFNEIQYSIDPSTNVSVQASRISLGIDNQVSIIAKELNITEDEAMAAYQENIRIRNLSNQKLPAPTLDANATAQAMGLV